MRCCGVGAWWWSALCLAGQVLYWQTLSGGWDGLGPVAYSLSLATSSDAEKVEQLKKALDLDPDFHYALSDLRVLEARLDRYAKKGRAVVDERTAKMLAVVDDTKASAQDRNMSAITAMNALMQQFRQ